MSSTRPVCHMMASRAAALAAALALAAPAGAQEAPATPDEPAAEAPAVEKGEAQTLVVEADPLAESYVEPNPSTLTKGQPLPLTESERRVDVVPKALMRDLGATTIDELYRAVPNLVLTEEGSFNLRGFGSGRGAMTIDGIHNSPFRVMSPYLLNVERVEVLKGPAGVIHGTGHAGGDINLVLEKPLSHDRYEFAAYFSSLGQRRVEVDGTGPLVGEDTLMYRFNVALEDSETFRANGQIDNAFLSLALTWNPHERVELTFQGFALEDIRTGGRGYGYPILDDDPYFLPRETSINEPTDQRRNRIAWGTLTTTVELAEDWGVELALFANDFRYSNRYHEGRRSTENVESRFIDRQWRDQSADSMMLGYDLRIRGELEAGPTKHRLLLGHDVRDFTNPMFPAIRARIANPASADRPNGAAPLDLLAPDYGAAAEETYTLTGDNETTADRLNLGVYATYRLTIIDDIHLMGGFRWDSYEETTHGENYLTGETSDTQDDSTAIAGQGGLVYEVFDDALSVYATLSTGFREQSWFQQGNPNGPFDPFRFTQYEVGVQGKALDGRLLATATVFRIDRENELVPDPDPTAEPGARVSQGVTRSEGVELTLGGRPVDGWDITGQFGLLDARVLESTGDNKDDPIAQVPEMTAGLWVAHDLGRLPLRLFGGFTYVGERPTHSDDSNPLATTMPAYTVLDVGGRFDVGGWSAQLNFFNVLDEHYFVHYRPPAHSLTPGSPRGVRLVLSATF